MDTSLRIPCIGEHSLLDEGIATDPPLVYFSHLLFDMSGSVTSNDPVRLDNLHQLRQGIINTRPNAALESPEQTRAELLQAVGDGSSSWPTRILAVDITSKSEGRSPAGLYDAHGGAVQIGYSTCPCDTDEESSNFLRELTHGLKISSSVCFPNTVYVKVDEEISSECKARLQACGAIHKFPRTKSVPILVEISGFENDSALLVVSLLESCGVDLSRVCLVGIVPSMSRIESIKLILEKTPCFVCFHSVGNIISPPVGPILPTDEEIVAVLVALKGYHAACLLSRVILSMNINCKIKMRGYGGPGFVHMVDSMIPRLRLAPEISEEDIRSMASTTALSLLRWYEPPELVQVEPEKMQCYLCGAWFIHGNHYEKYQFLYCSSKCLSQHRKDNYKRKGGDSGAEIDVHRLPT